MEQKAKAGKNDLWGLWVMRDKYTRRVGSGDTTL